MDLGLSEKVVFVTGASGGIGRALAEEFAAAGARLLLHGHGGFDELSAWVSAQEWSDRALCVHADVREPEELEAAVGVGLDRFGQLDVCVANAGKWPPGDLRLDELTVDRVRDTVSVNLLGAAWTARAFLRALASNGARPDGHGASVTFIGSTAGRFGERGHVDYAMAKAGLVGVMRTLKNEIVALDAYGRVNLVEPGWTVTHMARPALDDPANIERAVKTMALRQLARAKDIARTVVWLSSPTAARHVTGQTVTVAGGMEGRVLWDDDEIDVPAIRERLAHE